MVVFGLTIEAKVQKSKRIIKNFAKISGQLMVIIPTAMIAKEPTKNNMMLVKKKEQ